MNQTTKLTITKESDYVIVAENPYIKLHHFKRFGPGYSPEGAAGRRVCVEGGLFWVHIRLGARGGEKGDNYRMRSRHVQFTADKEQSTKDRPFVSSCARSG